MKKLPLKYRLNVIGAALLVFLCIRTYLPQLAAGMGLDKHFTLWLFVCILSLALSCLLPIMLIEKMCEFHPLLLKKKKIEEYPVKMRARTEGVSSISPMKSVYYMIKVSMSIILVWTRR